MASVEKATYLVYERGLDPGKFRLGNLVIFPRNPRERDPFICPYRLDDLGEWTGPPQEESDFAVDFQVSHSSLASVNVSSLVGGEVGSAGSSYLRLEGKNARRYEIDQATEFLNKVTLGSPGAKEWLHSRLTIARKMYYLNQLKLGQSRHPQIWMVTGIQLVSDVSVRNGWSSSSKAAFTATVPSPEPVSAVAAALFKDGGLGGKASISKDAETSVEYSHKGERVWAAQFRRLRVDFHKQGGLPPNLIRDISLHDLFNFGRLGMKGDAAQVADGSADVSADVTSVQEAGVDGIEDTMTDKDWIIFDKLKNASNKRALLIAGAKGELKGTKKDLAVMSDLLLDRGFDITICEGDNANRSGIISAWRRLIQQTTSGDTVVVYYTGHGSSSESISSDEAWRIQYIVPTDHDQSKEGDFRGILDVELSLLVTGLTNVTHNVTIILDCCHSERMARGDFQAKSIPPEDSHDRYVESHLRQLREAGVLERDTHIEGNPYAVRVVAAESDKPAFEGPDSEYGKMGQLTRELAKAIKDYKSDSSTSWNVVLEHLRYNLHYHGPQNFRQRPQVEGPKMRSLFSLDRLDYAGQLGLNIKNGRVILMGGLLAGIREGDVYAILPSAAFSADSAQFIAEVGIGKVRPTTSDVRIAYRGQHASVPQRAKAFPLRSRRPGHGIQIQANDASISGHLRSRIDNARFVYNFGDGGLDITPFAKIKQENGKLFVPLLDRTGAPTFEFKLPVTGEPREAIEDAVSQLEKLARADQLLTLDVKPSYLLDTSSISFELGYVDGKEATPLQNEDYSLRAGQFVYLKIQNNGEKTVFASVFLVTFTGTIDWMSDGSPSGVEILPKLKDPYILGQNEHARRLRGIRLSWPKSMRRDGPHDEAFVVILTDRKMDLGFLGTEYIHEAARRERDRGYDYDQDEDDMCYNVHRLNFKFKPEWVD